jgi:hypothetical protein
LPIVPGLASGCGCRGGEFGAQLLDVPLDLAAPEIG